MGEIDKHKNDAATKEKAVSDAELEQAQYMEGLLRKATNSYQEAKPETTEAKEAWLSGYLKEEVPSMSDEEVEQTAKEVLVGMDSYQGAHDDLAAKRAEGMNRDQWFYNNLKDQAHHMGQAKFTEYITGIDKTLMEANDRMMDTILTKSGTINQNPNLDGFIAEQELANSFNQQAALQNSDYRATVKVPEAGKTYGKNSVDISIDNIATGQKNVQRYQVKMGKDADATAQMVLDKDYRNQQILTAKGQGKAVQGKLGNKTVTERLESPDGVQSTSLSKAKVKAMQKRAQSGRGVAQKSWNQYDGYQLSKYIGQQVGIAGVAGAALGSGMHIMGKILDGKDVKSDEVIEAAIVSGADAGAKAATSGALVVATRLGKLPIPKNTSSMVLGAAGSILIDNVKVLAQLGDGKITPGQAVDKMAENTAAGYFGLEGAAMGVGVGATLCSVVPVVGTVVGGVIGGIAGSTVGKALYKGAKAIVKGAKAVAKTAYKAVKSVAKAAVRVAKKAWNWLFG